MNNQNVVIQSVEQSGVHKGRWGYYPCSYETYLKLKELYQYYLLSLTRRAEWTRWARKQPQNRVIRRWLRDSQGRRNGYEIVGQREEPKLIPLLTSKQPVKDYLGKDLGVENVVVTSTPIEINYRRARFPVSEANAVQPLTMTETEIDQILESLRSWKNLSN